MRTIEMGATSLMTDGLATAMPATALVTDTAGVKIPSARVKLVPNIHCARVRKDRVWWGGGVPKRRVAIATSERWLTDVSRGSPSPKRRATSPRRHSAVLVGIGPDTARMFLPRL